MYLHGTYIDSLACTCTVVHCRNFLLVKQITFAAVTTLLCFYLSILIHMFVRTCTYTVLCHHIIYCPLSIYALSQVSLQILFITSFKLLYERWLFWEFSLHGVENQHPLPMGNLRTITYKPFDPRLLDMKFNSSFCWSPELYYVLRKSVTM
jgi:hypothetical protein